jgi:hypothetical protein
MDGMANPDPNAETLAEVTRYADMVHLLNVEPLIGLRL